MFNDVRGSNLAVLKCDHVLQNGLNQGEINRDPVEASEGRNSDKRPLELSDVRGNLGRNVFQNIVANSKVFGRSLFPQNCDSGLQVRNLNVRNQPPTETASHALFKTNELLRRNVTGDDNLLAVFVQCIESVEEGVLCRVLPAEELNVINEKEVDLSITPVEGNDLVRGQGIDVVVRELFTRDVTDLRAGEETLRVVTDCMEEVRLAQSRPAIDEQGVVSLGRRLADGESSRVSEAV